VSQEQQFSPTITAFKPDIDSTGGGGYDLPGTPILPALTSQIESYSHIIQAVGGYWSAQFSINTDQRTLEKWVTEGLGRHIEVVDSAGVIIWEGIVNKVSASLGPLDIVTGPMMDVGNLGIMEYSTLNTTVDPPIFGAQTEVFNLDMASIGKYGYWPMMLSGGSKSDADAANQLDTFVLENAWPTNSKTVNMGRAADPQVRVECLGYVHLYIKMPYNGTTSGTQNLSDKIIDVLDFQFNAITNDTWLQIATNALQVPGWDDRQNNGWQVIKDLVAMGDASFSRYLFGMYANQMPKYAAAPTTLEYQQQLSDPEQKVTTISGGRVLPWHVLPGKWMTFSDFLVGESEPADLRRDPRAMFIESVTFTAPWGLGLKGGKIDTFSQKLAQTGLGTRSS